MSVKKTNKKVDIPPKEPVEDIFEVEEIRDKKIIDGKTHYKIKWKGYDEITWEPIENCHCKGLIKQFEKRLKEKKLETLDHDSDSSKIQSKKFDSETDSHIEIKKETVFNQEYIKNLLSRNLKVEKIIGITDEPGELTFLIKWKNVNEPDLVPSRFANEKFPQDVIKFYEKKLVLNNDKSNSKKN